jgi:excisionase family DNA binding protein
MHSIYIARLSTETGCTSNEQQNMGDTSPSAAILPMLKTVQQMSHISGIGENKLRELIDSGEIEYVQNGNRRLLADEAIWDWYKRAKQTAKATEAEGVR